MTIREQTPEELATSITEQEQAEYRAAKEAVIAAITPNLGRTTITDVRRAIYRQHPEIKHRFINSALVDLRGSLFRLESDGRITPPR